MFYFEGLDSSMVKEEIFPELDIFSCIDGFSVILSSSGDVIYVSDNVHRYIGLSQVRFSNLEENQNKNSSPG